MIHTKAEEWDKQYSKSPEHHTTISSPDGKVSISVPINRPCDRCGELVDVGYIHETCEKEERKFWLSVFLD